jgi:hypothetical protein
LSKISDFLWAQGSADGDSAQVGVQGVPPVGFIEDFAARSVSLEHVQNITTDLDDLGFLDSNDRSRTRIAIQASHLSEDDVFGSSVDFRCIRRIRGVRSSG